MDSIAAPVVEDAQTQQAAVAAAPECEECVGAGGWYRYEPSLDPAPGMLYLSCLQCRGSGRTAAPRG